MLLTIVIPLLLTSIHIWIEVVIHKIHVWCDTKLLTSLIYCFCFFIYIVKYAIFFSNTDTLWHPHLWFRAWA